MPVHIVPILRDNYCFVIQGLSDRCVIVDPGQVAPVVAYITEKKLTPALILNTHHHADHVAGNAELKEKYNVPVIGPAAEQKRIPHMDKGVKGGDVIEESGLRLQVIETPGHTNGHVCFYSAEFHALFCGDTVFGMGCGRLLEGSAEDMFASLQTIKSLPPETRLYWGHEYTEANGRFAAAVEPENSDITARILQTAKLRANNLPTLPGTLDVELKTNPFLRADSAKKFAELRLRKDNF